MTTSPPVKPLRVLVVDDSAYNRQALSAILESSGEIAVVGRATNGKEALHQTFDLDPDVITLDLEMPEMDGFAFLRLLMNRRPTPVIVVSGYAQPENVFRALELGALDFIAKPSRRGPSDLHPIAADLVAKVSMVRRLQAVRLKERAKSLAAQRGEAFDRSGAIALQGREAVDVESRPPPLGVVGIAASTGGPSAIQQLLCGLSADSPLAFVIAQHMPPRFTRTFAERLDRIGPLRVVEAADGQALRAGIVYVAPGAAEIQLDAERPERLGVKTVGVRPGLAPSADQLFASLAARWGTRFCACVLTGMGSDGTAGARAARAAGGRVLAEDPKTAVMPGMPQSAIDARTVDEVLSLEDMGAAIRRFAQTCLQR